MKKIIIGIILFLICNISFAADTAVLQDQNGVALGTVGNPLHVTGSSGGILSSLAWVDCISTANGSDGSICAGVNTTTTSSGTNNSGQKVLNVASTTGWTAGMGVAVQNAGTGGNTELISYVTSVQTGVSLTMNDNIVTTITTGQTVNHDDTRALTDACSGGLNVHLRSGFYPVTSNIACNGTFILQGDGSSEQVGGTPPTGPNASIIWNRGTTNNILDFVTNGATVGVVQIYNISVQQATGITPTAGYQLIIAGPSSHIHQFALKDSSFWGGFGGISIGNAGTSGNLDSSVFDNITIRYRGNSTSSRGFFYNDASPNGDNVVKAVYVAPIGASGYNYYITASDTTTFSDDKSNQGDTGVVIDDSNGVTSEVRFINLSCEGASGAGGNSGCVQMTASAVDKVFDIQFVGGESLVNATSKFAINIGTNVRNVQVNGLDIHGNASGSSGGIRIATLAGNVTINGVNCTNVPTCIASSSSTLTPNLSIVGTTCNSQVTTCVSNAGGVQSTYSQGCVGGNCNIGLGEVPAQAILDVWGSVGPQAIFHGTGNVGIGTVTPTQLLDVRGTVKFTTGLINTTSATGIGWSEHNATNQACNTTCGSSACVIGLDIGTVGVVNSGFVACTDATGDDCVCAGP